MAELSHEFSKEADPLIPEISDEVLVQRWDEFRLLYGPERRVVQMPGAELVHQLRRTSCIWSPVLGEPRAVGSEQRAIPFYVSCGYYGFFKPSVAEVMSQAPVDELRRDGFNAYYIGDHVEILRSGGFQKATAFFVRASHG